MFLKIFCLLLSLVLAVAGGLLGSRWISEQYEAEREVLSFPERTSLQERRRPALLAGLLGLVFSWSVLTSGLLRADGNALHDAVFLAFLLLFQFFLILYTVTDFEQQVIFDRMLVPFAVLGLVSLPLLGRPLGDHLLAMVAGGAVFLALAIVTRGGIGGGDIKLIAALGLWLGCDQLLTVGVSGILLGGLAALVLLACRRRKRGDMFAYGPYFTIAAIVLTLA